MLTRDRNGCQYWHFIIKHFNNLELVNDIVSFDASSSDKVSASPSSRHHRTYIWTLERGSIITV